MTRSRRGDLMFYTFSQNNSGGDFYCNDNLGEYVIIEADDEDDACARAEEIGIYFHGVDSGDDCECCGDRWSRPWEDGTETPLIYEEAPEKALTGMRTTVVIHYADGSKKTLRRKS